MQFTGYKKNNSDKSLLTCKGTVELGEVKNIFLDNGHWKVSGNNKIFDIFYHEKQDSDTLYVFLNGSRAPGESPAFKRWSYFPLLNGSLLNIDDIMYQDFPDLWLGWYYGTNDTDYVDYVVEIAKTFQIKNNASKIVYFGSSGGGNAAIRCAEKHPNSTAIVINPQIVLEKYHSGGFFQRTTSLKFSEDRFFRNDTTKNLDNGNGSKYLFIENIASEDDKNQINYLLNKFNIDNVDYGLSKVNEDILIWTYDAPQGGAPHDNQDYFDFAKIIFLLVEKICNRVNFNDIVKEYTQTIKIASDLLHEHYDRVLDTKKIKRKIYEFPFENELFDLSKMEKVFEKHQITNKQADNIYNRYEIPYKLEPNSLYFITITDIDYSMYDDGVDFLIKDNLLNVISLQKRLKKTQETLMFLTNEDTKKENLYLYNGLLGSCNKYSLNIGSIILYKISSIKKN